MTKWTDSQSEAIDSRGSNLLISAAAGSGKTAVLVERIIKLIVEDKVDIDRLLIVTFTNAAAGEMRERILKAITDEMEKPDSDEKNLRKQMTLLNKASITTLHSFCINVIRKNFHVIGIDPTFRIADVTESKVLTQESLEEILEEEYEKANDDFVSLIESFSENKSDRKIEDLIVNIHEFIQSQPDPYGWLEESAEEFNIDVKDLKKNIWIKTVIDDISMKLAEAKNNLEEAINISKEPYGPEKYLEILPTELENVENLMASIDLYIQGDMEIRDLNIEFKTIPSITKKMIATGDFDETLKDNAKALRDEAKEIVNSLISKEGILTRDMASYTKDILEMHPVMKYLYEIVKLFGERFKSKKLEKGILGFSDLEHFALEALENEDVQKELREYYKHIFIDEYQDSNIVQETIIARIKDKKNLFLVGDVKQSIYRFRLADPSLFIEKYNSYSRDKSSDNRRIDLSKNFRSRKEVLDGVNFIFKNIMSEKLGEVDYTEDAYLYVGANYQDLEDNSIELNIIEKKRDKEDDEELDEIDFNLEEMSDAEVEATLVAERIKNLIGTKTYDAKLGEFRDISYKDIVILFRAARTWGGIYEEVFISQNIPVYVDDSSGYFDVLEVKTFLNLLKLIDNKRQDLPLLSVMRSPIGNFTTEELIQIRINYKDKYSSYYKALETYIEEQDDELSKKLESFIGNLDRWNEESLYIKLDEFMWKLMTETGYYYYAGAMTGGIQRQANLRILIDRANQFERASITGLFNFIRFADKLQSAKGDMGVAKILGENEDVVRIMTIHKSKGLEFPVVICGGLGKRFSNEDMKGDILLHKDLGLGAKYVDANNRVSRETLPRIAIKNKKKTENLSEEMRILYVALTRAKDRLILIGTVENIPKRATRWSKKISTYNLLTSMNYMDWIGTSLFNHIDGQILRELADVDSDGRLDIKDPSKWKINIVDQKDIFEKRTVEEEKKYIFKESLEDFKREEHTDFKAEIEEKFKWEYPYGGSIKIPSKVTVSNIEKLNSSEIENVNYNIPSLVKMPRFLEEAKDFTAAEKGTIIHFVMQHLTLEKGLTRDGVEKQIEMMTFNELLTDEEAKVIDREKISLFMKSDIGKRMLSSDKVFREVPFVYKKNASKLIHDLDSDESIYIQGIIDCYFEEDGEIVLVDYKTDYVEKDISVLTKRYQSQMSTYKEAIEKITGKIVKESFIYSFNLNKEVKID